MEKVLQPWCRPNAAQTSHEIQWIYRDQNFMLKWLQKQKPEFYVKILQIGRKK